MYEHYMLVYGLSANSPHQSHVELVVDAVKALVARKYPIARVLLIPVYRRNLASKQKENLPQTVDSRFVLCTLAAEEMVQRLETVGAPVQVSRIEEQLARPRETPNFTLETLSVLHAGAPDTGLIFLLSSDLVSGEDRSLGGGISRKSSFGSLRWPFVLGLGISATRCSCRALDSSHGFCFSMK